MAPQRPISRLPGAGARPSAPFSGYDGRVNGDVLELTDETAGDDAPEAAVEGTASETRALAPVIGTRAVRAPGDVDLSDLEALREGARVCSQAGNRTASTLLLQITLALDPLDRTAHRRLAASFANAGDVDAAAAEYLRFTETVLQHGDLQQARDELAYGVAVLGDRSALRAAARSIRGAIDAALRIVRPARLEPVPTPLPQPEIQDSRIEAIRRLKEIFGTDARSAQARLSDGR